jgi:protein JBTS26
LNGIEVLNADGEPIPITVSPDSSIGSRTNVEANPRDMNSIAGHGSDHRTLEKLFNDRNNTKDDRNMWLIPYNKGEDHTIMIDLGETRAISGIKFYNYNKSTEDTLRGARQVIIKVDD